MLRRRSHAGALAEVVRRVFLLATHAGHTVVLTGAMKGDTLTVSKIEMPTKEPA